MYETRFAGIIAAEVVQCLVRVIAQPTIIAYSAVRSPQFKLIYPARIEERFPVDIPGTTDRPKGFPAEIRVELGVAIVAQAPAKHIALIKIIVYPGEVTLDGMAVFI